MEKNMLFRTDLDVRAKKRLPQVRTAFDDLEPEDRSTLAAIYRGSAIEAIEPPTEDERSQFSGGEPALNVHLQTLYKYEGNLEPSRFIQAIRDMTEQEECLRTNYCLLNGEIRRVILSRRRDVPNIICQDLSSMEPKEQDDALERIMEGDMLLEFDLQQGALFRVSSFRTGETEYAVLVTVSLLIASRFDAGKLFRQLGKVGDARTSQTSVRESSVPRKRPLFTEEDAPDSLPPFPSLPYEKAPHGDYRQASYRKWIPGNIISGLKKLSSDQWEVLMAALETAWGLLLLENSPREETCSPLLLSSSQNTSDFCVILARLRKSSDNSMEHTVAEQAAQIGQNAKNGRISPAVLSSNHFISFYDFLRAEKPFSESPARPEGTVIARNLWFARGMTLGVYFRRTGSRVLLTFLYDKSRFKPYGIELIAQKYLRILQKMLFEWKQPLSSFSQDALPDTDRSNIKPHVSPESAWERLHSFVSGLEFFREIPSETLYRDITAPRNVACLMGDMVPGKDIEENFIFLVRGNAVRNIDPGDGSFNYLDFCSPNAWLNESVLLTRRKTKLSIEIMSEDATLLYIPVQEMNRLMNDEPLVMRRMLVHAVAAMEKYQKLWVMM